MFQKKIRFARRTWLILAGVCVAAGFTYYAAMKMTVVHRANAQVAAAPFLAEMHTYTYKSSSVGELLAKRIIARRSDGTTASIHSAGPIERGWTSKKIQYM